MLLGSMLVRDIMTTCVVALREHQSLQLASALGFARGEDHLPVVDESGRFLGLVNHRDVVAAERGQSVHTDDELTQETVPLSSVLSPVAETVLQTTSVEDALELMLSSRLGLLPVVDDQDGFCGLVTMDGMLALCEEWAESVTQTVASIMTRALLTATAETTVPEAIHMMRSAEVRHLPVITPYGKLRTIVSLRDLITYQRLSARDAELNPDAAPVCLVEFMGTDVWTTTASSTIVDVVRTLRDNRFGCLPIVEEKHLLGIVTETDLLRAFLSGNRKQAPVVAAKSPIRHFMSVASPIVSPDDLVEKALGLFVEKNPSTLLVVKDGKPVGILSQSDMTRSMHIPRFSGVDGARARFLERPISEIMTRGVISIDANKDVSEAAAFLTQQKVHSLIVFDKKESVGTFGPHEIFRAAGRLRAAGQLREIMTNVIFEIDCQETLRAAMRFLDTAGVRRLIVRDGDHAVGTFGQHEALAAGDLSLETPVEQLMSCRIVCLPDDTPCFRAAEQAGALGVDEILVTEQGDSCGLASASDFAHLLVNRNKNSWTEDTVDDIKG